MRLTSAIPRCFAPFSSPRLFTALDTNVMDVWFFVPGSTTVAAGVTGFGAVFTHVTSETSTRLEFYAPDGALLFAREVPWAAGNETLSFLGVSFDKGGDRRPGAESFSGTPRRARMNPPPATWSSWTTSCMANRFRCRA